MRRILAMVVSLSVLGGCGKEGGTGATNGDGGSAAGGSSSGGGAGVAQDASLITCVDDFTVKEADGASYICPPPQYCVAGCGCGARCTDDHTEDLVGLKYGNCGANYCVPCQGCRKYCDKNEDCRLGALCQPITQDAAMCSWPIPYGDD